MLSKFQSRSSRDDVLAEVNGNWITAKEIAGHIGVVPQTALMHLWAAAFEGLVEYTERFEDGHYCYLWRKAR